MKQTIALLIALAALVAACSGGASLAPSFGTETITPLGTASPSGIQSEPSLGQPESSPAAPSPTY